MSEQPQNPVAAAETAGPEGPAAGERAALVERLFREHNDALVRFLAARLRSQQEAREVAQEAYVRLLSLDEPGAVSYLRAFLFRTAANLAMDRRRREVVDARAKASPFFDQLTDSRTPERQIAAGQTVERLERLIAALPAKCRRAFMLRRFDGMDVSSIASELQLSKRMVREYVARALLQVRAGLDLDVAQHGKSRDESDD